MSQCNVYNVSKLVGEAESMTKKIDPSLHGIKFGLDF